jgi:PEGA domain
MTLAQFAAAQLLMLAALAAQTSQTGAAPAATVPAMQEHVLQDGIPVKLRLSAPLSSEKAEVGQEIAFEVVDDLDVDGVTVLRRGTFAMGVVTQALARKRLGQPGKLNFRIDYVPLADTEKAKLRAITNSKGDSRTDGMVGLMLSAPVVAAPFFLLIKGGESAFPKGSELTAFIDGDMPLDLRKFLPEQPHGQETSVKAALSIESMPGRAEIEIDGMLVGTTPAVIEVDAGRHTILVKKEGFAQWSTNIEAAVGKVTIKAELQKREPR